MSGGLAWPLVVAAMMILNTVLAEELLFRGVLLPRMQGAFGRADWVVNGVLFAAYHLHQPWSIPGALYDMLILAYPAKRFRSAVISILVHSTQTLFFLVAAALLLVR
jgi:membrane protease YdiL (CAAX protease family)